MGSKQVYFASPSGNSLILRMQKKSAALPSYGMYRTEVDVTSIVMKQVVPDLLEECLNLANKTRHMFLNMHSGPEIDLGRNFSIVGKNKTSVVFNASNGISKDVLVKLTNLPYGEISILGLAVKTSIPECLHLMVDLDSSVKALGESVSWALGFDESAVLTLFARDGDVTRQQVLKILEKVFNF